MTEDTTGSGVPSAPDPSPTRSWDTDPTTALPAPDVAPTIALGGTGPGPSGSAPPGWASTPGGSGAATVLLPNPRIAPYLEAVRAVLADLPADERAELLDDLDAHLGEILSEEADAFEARMGSPADYAAEFRTSAGYPAPGSPGADRAGALSTARTDAYQWAQAQLEKLTAWVLLRPGGSALMDFLPRLRPAWWVMRAWLVALMLSMAWPTTRPGGGWLRALVWQLLLVVASVAWGLRAERRSAPTGRGERLALGALNGVAVWLCVLAVFGAGPVAWLRQPTPTHDQADVYSQEAYPVGLSANGVPVTNLVAYDLAGNRIDGFQLFDQNGAPVTVDEPNFSAPSGGRAEVVPVTDAVGGSVSNVYPIRRVELGSDVCPNADLLCTDAEAPVLRALPMPAGSPWTSLSLTPVPPAGSMLPFDEHWDPIWSGVQAPTGTATSPVEPSASGQPEASTPSTSPSPSTAASTVPTTPETTTTPKATRSAAKDR